MSNDDPRTQGLDVPLRPPRTSSIRPPARSESTLRPSAGGQGAAVGSDGDSPKPDIHSLNNDHTPRAGHWKPAAHSQRSPSTPRRRVGSVRGNTVMLSTSVPYQIADALGARAYAENITMGEVLMAAVRHHAADVVGSPPPRPKRSGGTAVRQILVGPLDAELVADYVAEASPVARLTTSRFLRHCLERELSPSTSSPHLTPHGQATDRTE